MRAYRNGLSRLDSFPRTTLRKQEVRRIAWNAIKLFYGLILKKPCFYKPEKIHPRHRIPSFLDRADIQLLLSRIRNPKLRLMISLPFSSGLSVSEYVWMKIHKENRRHEQDLLCPL
jgi:site-specific recombinase XerD